MNACQQADRASRNSGEGAGRAAERAELINDINPHLRSIGLADAGLGRVRSDFQRRKSRRRTGQAILSRLGTTLVNIHGLYADASANDIRVFRCPSRQSRSHAEPGIGVGALNQLSI